jgi:hypothetical protein
VLEYPDAADSFQHEEVLSTSVISMDASLLDSVRAAYKNDRFFGPVIAYPE